MVTHPFLFLVPIICKWRCKAAKPFSESQKHPTPWSSVHAPSWVSLMNSCSAPAGLVTSLTRQGDGVEGGREVTNTNVCLQVVHRRLGCEVPEKRGLGSVFSRKM